MVNYIRQIIIKLNRVGTNIYTIYNVLLKKRKKEENQLYTVNYNQLVLQKYTWLVVYLIQNIFFKLL